MTGSRPRPQALRGAGATSTHEEDAALRVHKTIHKGATYRCKVLAPETGS